ncbi:MAG: hypothetical protein HKN49_11610 [Gammaproteobacteria bacterium]|nr:hypothetical protein [Gammaproteobacteria bacterium]
MFNFFRKSRRAKNNVPHRDSSRQSTGVEVISAQDRGHNPYDTVAGISRSELGMRRRDDGKWSF